MTLRATVNDHKTLRTLIRVDFSLGGLTGIAGLLFDTFFSDLFQLSPRLLQVISIVTLLYSFVAGFLVVSKRINLRVVLLLVWANWCWAAVSILLLVFFSQKATTLGVIFLALQFVIVGGLAYFEGRQISIIKKPG